MVKSKKSVRRRPACTGGRTNPDKKAYPPHAGKWYHIFNHKWTEEEITQIADEMLEWFISADAKGKEKIWMRDFCIEKKLPEQRFCEFAKQNEYFNYVYSICKLIQESKLVKLGLSKQINSILPVLALRNVAGWRDKQEVDHNFIDPNKAKKEIKEIFE